MRKIIQAFVLTILILIPFSTSAFAAETVEINSLIENAKVLDKTEVTVQGEAIGEMLNRGEYSWVNINDGTNAIGVKLKTADAQRITHYGDYKNKGDMIRVTGIFNRACPENGGETDIHGESVQIVEAGGPVKESVPLPKVITAVLLTVCAVAVVLLLKKRIHDEQIN
ncbi:hypothetical protein ACVS9P_09185 [Caproicibacterium sp. NSD3]